MQPISSASLGGSRRYRTGLSPCPISLNSSGVGAGSVSRSPPAASNCARRPRATAKVNDGARNSQLHLALLNEGVDPMSNGTRLIVGQAHSDQDVADTVDAYESALGQVRELGLV